MKFVIASHNQHKIIEFNRILSAMGIELINPELIEAEENGSTFMENAIIKAQSACDETGLPSVADDTGLCVKALGGEPGIHSARHAEPGKRKARVLERLEGIKDREAYFICAIACVFPNGDIIKAEGICEGYIAEQCIGDNGFGYDPIFMVGDKSYAQMTHEEKDEVSHRGKALRNFEKQLKEYIGEN